MNTGEPDMPANTLVRSTFGPLSFAIMVDCRGPVKPGSTPRISTPNSCASLPENTVRATPFIPGRKSSSGNKAAAGAVVVAEVLTTLPWPSAAIEKVESAVMVKMRSVNGVFSDCMFF